MLDILKKKRKIKKFDVEEFGVNIIDYKSGDSSFNDRGGIPIIESIGRDSKEIFFTVKNSQKVNQDYFLCEVYHSSALAEIADCLLKTNKYSALLNEFYIFVGMFLLKFL